MTSARSLGVPTTDGLWRFVGTGGHGRLLAEALEVADNFRVLAVDHVLVPERLRADACPMRMSALQARPARGGERLSRVCLKS